MADEAEMSISILSGVFIKEVASAAEANRKTLVGEKIPFMAWVSKGHFRLDFIRPLLKTERQQTFAD